MREYPVNCGTYSYDAIFFKLSKFDLFVLFQSSFYSKSLYEQYLQSKNLATKFESSCLNNSQTQIFSLLFCTVLYYVPTYYFGIFKGMFVMECQHSGLLLGHKGLHQVKEQGQGSCE